MHILLLLFNIVLIIFSLSQLVRLLFFVLIIIAVIIIWSQIQKYLRVLYIIFWIISILRFLSTHTYYYYEGNQIFKIKFNNKINISFKKINFDSDQFLSIIMFYIHLPKCSLSTPLLTDNIQNHFEHHFSINLPIAYHLQNNIFLILIFYNF